MGAKVFTQNIASANEHAYIAMQVSKSAFSIYGCQDHSPGLSVGMNANGIRLASLMVVSLGVHLVILLLVLAISEDSPPEPALEKTQTIRLQLLQTDAELLQVAEQLSIGQSFGSAEVQSVSAESAASSLLNPASLPKPTSLPEPESWPEPESLTALPTSALPETARAVQTIEPGTAEAITQQAAPSAREGRPVQAPAPPDSAEKQVLVHLATAEPENQQSNDPVLRHVDPSPQLKTLAQQPDFTVNDMPSLSGMKMLEDTELAQVAVLESPEDQNLRRWSLIRQYLAEVERQIYSVWRHSALRQVSQWPQDLRGVIRFELDEQGKLQASYVHMGSGNAGFDRSILKALSDALRPYTDETRQLAALNYRFFRFDYNARGQAERRMELLPWEQNTQDGAR